MTSRVSFHKLLMETLRRHIAAVLITALVFVIHIISFFLTVQNTLDIHVITETLAYGYTVSDISNTEHIMEELIEISAPSLVNAILALFVGGFLAFDFFKYLHSKRQTDLYDSMPIRKEKWFITLFVAGFGIFLIPCAITTGIEIAMIYGTGFGSTTILQNMLWNLLCMIGVFLAGWVTTTLAMIMTGHTVIAFLGVVVFSTYFPLIINYLFPAYAEKFFETYVYKTGTFLFYLSPASLAYKTAYNWRLWNISEHWTYLVGCFVFALVIGLIAYFLFLKRPSESAGRAMAFKKANSIIRFLLVLPLSLYVGLFLSEMAAYGEVVWLVFGIIFANIILHGIIECVFQFDIKALFSKKRQLLIGTLLCLGFVAVYWLDLFQYDAYMPEAEDLKSITIDSNLFNNDKYSELIEKDGLTGDYIEKALLAIKDIRNCDNNIEKSNRYYTSFTVTYSLKNGMERQRCYDYYADTIPGSLDNLYATKEFKDDFCMLYHVDTSDIISVKVNNAVEIFTLNLSTDEKKELVELYLNEFTNMKFEESASNTILYQLIVETPSKDQEYNLEGSYDVYSNFTKTLNYLKNYQITSFGESQNIVPVNLEIYGGKYTENEPRYISDAKQLATLKPYIIPSSLISYMNNEEYVYCDLRYEYNGATNYMSVYIKPEHIQNVLKQ